MRFAAYMRKRRAEQGLSLNAVAGMVGLSIQYVSDVERGKRPPSPKLLDRWSELFESDRTYVYFLANRIPPVVSDQCRDAPVLDVRLAFERLARDLEGATTT